MIRLEEDYKKRRREKRAMGERVVALYLYYTSYAVGLLYRAGPWC